MKRTKPLSFDEKRQRLLRIFHERVRTNKYLFNSLLIKKEVLNLKELEKYGPKEGIGCQPTFSIHNYFSFTDC